jgi:hypothetical protein
VDESFGIAIAATSDERTDQVLSEDPEAIEKWEALKDKDCVHS